MIKNEKGITLVSLIITIMVMIIISATTTHYSLRRFDINNVNKMYNDITLLKEKVSNYYLKYGGLPVVRDNNGLAVQYTYTTIDFETNPGDNNIYYILDLSAMDGISLNYGKTGFENINTSDDVYIINELSHTIYYVKGKNLDGVTYRYLQANASNVNDLVPPTTPEIRVLSGQKDTDNSYYTNIQLEFVPGMDKASGIEKTTYSVNGGTEIDITTLTNNLYTISANGTYEIKLKSYDNKGNYKETTSTFTKKTISISLNQTNISEEITIGSTVTKTITATSTNIEGDLIWTTSDASIVEISGEENNTKTITIKKAGTATIKVSYGTTSATCNITVTEKQVTTISFTIDGVTYQAEAGMTWEEWIDSPDYDSGTYLIDYADAGYAVYTSDYSKHISDAFDKVTDPITENYSYSLATVDWPL